MSNQRELRYRSFASIDEAVAAAREADLPNGVDFILTIGGRKSHELHAVTANTMEVMATNHGFSDVSPHLIERQNISVALPV